MFLILIKKVTREFGMKKLFVSSLSFPNLFEPKAQATKFFSFTFFFFRVPLKVNKLTSTKTLLPIDYYRLPFCLPYEGPTMDDQNLGQLLSGDRIQSSPYRIRMLEEMYCEQLCVVNIGRQERQGLIQNKMVRAIQRNYQNNWILDDLPAASTIEDDSTITTRYGPGFPVGYVADDGKSYVNNHVNIEVQYHEVADSGRFRIVRFTVLPFSVKHEFDFYDGDTENDYNQFKVAEINNPIESCKPNSMIHTKYDMLNHNYIYNNYNYNYNNYNYNNDNNREDPQPASGKVLFTYDVTWRENKEVRWASRWDIYLTMENAIPTSIHWFSITNSLIIIFVLSAMIAAILIRNLRHDYERYSRLGTENEKLEDLEEFGWKLLHADVFRPPTFSPLFLAVMCGTGAQLLCTAFLTMFFAAFGFWGPPHRGSLLMAILSIYVLMGSILGYVTARFYKTFGGESTHQAMIFSVLGFPSIAFIGFIMVNFLALAQGSTIAVPFFTYLILLMIWSAISVPLAFFGFFVGNKQSSLEFPLETSTTPRHIPDQAWFMSIPFRLTVGGVLPFGVVFVEFYFVMASLWLTDFYYTYGFLLLVFITLIITCAEITVLFCYFQLSGGNYHWWWSSFCTAGSLGLYILFYSITFSKQMNISHITSSIFFFTYMGLVSFAFFLAMGFVGVCSSFWFNKALYGTIENR